MLKVYPNPFTALGPDGMPCGRLYDLGHPRPYEVLGGKLVRKVVERAEDENRAPKERAAARKLDTRGARVLGAADVRMKPMSVAPRQDMRAAVACGDLIAADKATAKACGIPEKAFRPALELLTAEMQTRAAEWRAINGELPALASFQLVADGDELKLVRRAETREEPLRQQRSDPAPAQETSPKAGPRPEKKKGVSAPAQ